MPNPRVLLEGDTFPFLPDRKVISESRASNGGTLKFPLVIPGRFSICDELNGNNRIYPRRVWESNLREDSALQKSIRAKSSFGLLEHPKDGNISLLSPISHLVTAVRFEGREVAGEITIVGTDEGAKLTALIEAGYNPYVSSRGYGSVVTRADGVDEVQEDFVCESWDAVLRPSFATAELKPVRIPAAATEALREGAASPITEAKREVKMVRGSDLLPDQQNEVKRKYVHRFTGSNKPEWAKKQRDDGRPYPLHFKDDADWLANTEFPTDGKGKLVDGDAYSRPTYPEGLDDKDKQFLGRVSESQTPAVHSPASPPQPETIARNMDLNTIRESLLPIQHIAQTPGKVTPKQVAENLARLGDLHNQVAITAATDPKLAWAATKLHEEISLVETQIGAAVVPASAHAALTESNTKALSVLKATAEAALVYKTKLGESLKAVDGKQKLVEEVTRRGQNWRQRSLTQESELKALRRKYAVATEALVIMRDRYHEDTSALGRRLVVVEHKVEDPKLLKRLAESKTAAAVADIRDEIKGVKGSISEGAAKKAPGKIVEGKPASAAPAPKAVVIDNAGINGDRPMSISESVDMVGRLSGVSLVG